MRIFIRYPLDTLHTPIVLSHDPDAKYSPSAENTTLQTEEECPMRVFIRYPLNSFFSPSLFYLFFSLSSLLPIFLSKYTLSATSPKLYCPFLIKVSFFLPPTSPVLIIYSISYIFSISYSHILFISSFAFCSIF